MYRNIPNIPECKIYTIQLYHLQFIYIMPIHSQAHLKALCKTNISGNI